MRNSFERVRTLTAHFDRISLGELSSATLMDRVDSKYCFSLELLPEVLGEILDDYLLLDIDKQAFQFYRTYYFDTPNDGFYLDHHNGRRKRVKVRIREYVNSHLSFLEVKQKCNTGQTRKYRRQIEQPQSVLDHQQSDFVGPYIGCPPSSLDIKIQNQFQRITLVNRNLRERCTLDLNVSFSSGDQRADLQNLVVLELKQERRDIPSPLATTLRGQRLRTQGFSKYCIGRALLQPDLKHNRLKPVLQRVRRHMKEETQPLQTVAVCG